jgi:preprotein translocase subunit SecA
MFWRQAFRTTTANSAATQRPVKSADAPRLIPHIRTLAKSLQSAPKSKLLDEVGVIRRELARGTPLSAAPLLVAGLALAVEALRRAQGVEVYDVQLLAAMDMSRRCVAQMQTGEGKTLAAIAAALHLSLAGRGVHVITPNVYLAERDSRIAASAAEVLDLSVGLLPDRGNAEQKVPAYDADITYGTGHEFGFDYLRDQLTLRQHARRRLGERLLSQLDLDLPVSRSTMQRGLAFAIVDEADSVLVDDAGSPLVLSPGTQQSAPDAEVHRAAKKLAGDLTPSIDYMIDRAAGRIAITESGIQKCYRPDIVIPVQQLTRPWTDYVQQALHARYLFRRGVNYVVDTDEVRIVDQSTGRIYEDRSWQDGLHQAIEALEELPITAERTPIAQITRQRFFRLYDHLSGMTGTAIGCEREFRDVYRLDVDVIPVRVPSRRLMLPSRFFATAAVRNSAVIESAVQMRNQCRAVLIGSRTISDSEDFAGQLASRQVPCQILNGLQDAEEADIIANAGTPGCITIATNLAGRGTDICLHPAVKEQGGLHVIVAECQTSGRMDRQLIGRCARQGDPGSAQIFVSAEDHLLTTYGPWLAAAIRREAGESGEVHADFTSQLNRIQKDSERHQYTSRMQMLKQDMERDTLLRRLS